MIKDIFKDTFKRKSSNEILSNNINTIRNLLFREKEISKNYRSMASFISSNNSVSIDQDIQKTLQSICVTNAFSFEKISEEQFSTIDLCKCIACGRCSDLYPELIKMERRFDYAFNKPTNIVIDSNLSLELSLDNIGYDLKKHIQKIFNRSISIREVDAGSCNGCEIEITSMNNPIYDIERFGINFVASPRHADVLLVTGPASRNMVKALQQTYKATPEPKIVIAVGACACSGGIFGDTYATSGGINNIVPVDVYIPGCPPRPQALLYGILQSINKKTVNPQKQT